jgi:predicted tellurium resistance membrane protein TerC
MDTLFSTDAIIPFLALFILELLLGIDNMVIIAMISGRVVKQRQRRVRVMGLIFALFTRLSLLLSLSWMMQLGEPLFVLFGVSVSGKQLLLLFGGLFLLTKSSLEIYRQTEDGPLHVSKQVRFGSALFQIVLFDLIFSLDSLITAVGLVNEIPIMVAAIVCSTLLMTFSIHKMADWIQRHPSLRILAFSFLLLIGTSLVAEAAGYHFPKGYIYFAMGYALGVELLSHQLRRRRKA